MPSSNDNNKYNANNNKYIDYNNKGNNDYDDDDASNRSTPGSGKRRVALIAKKLPIFRETVCLPE